MRNEPVDYAFIFKLTELKKEKKKEKINIYINNIGNVRKTKASKI